MIDLPVKTLSSPPAANAAGVFRSKMIELSDERGIRNRGRSGSPSSHITQLQEYPHRQHPPNSPAGDSGSRRMLNNH